MALINCPECNNQVSDKAPACPQCGSPVASTEAPVTNGRRELTQQEVAVMLSKKKKTNHVLHLILSIITVGFWVIIWLIVALSNSLENSRIDRQIAKGKKVLGAPKTLKEEAAGGGWS